MVQEKVLIGMSGGVDSSVAALILKEQGFETAGTTLILCKDAAESAANEAKSVCDTMGIAHYTVNLKKQFEDIVVKDFIEEYKRGNTPNPCITCNKYIKFSLMLDKAKELGFSKIATGHYARVKQSESGRYLLLKAKDESKDQSYVLSCLTSEQLSHVLFPLGEYTKAEIREIARNNGFVNADKADSQDICFVPDGDYAAFIEENGGFTSKPGDYTDITGKVLGKHKGVIHYTIGQRKGLGIALGKPAFVLDKNSDTNTVVLGDEEHLFKREVLVKDVNFISIDLLEVPMPCQAKLRYRHTAAPAVISPCGDMVKIVFETPQRAPSSGQTAVFYDGDIVIGGGKIV